MKNVTVTCPWCSAVVVTSAEPGPARCHSCDRALRLAAVRKAPKRAYEAPAIVHDVDFSKKT